MRGLGSLRLALGLTLLAAGGAHASSQTPYGPPIVHLGVIDREAGENKPVYLHDRRYFVAGRTGARYGLLVQNMTGGRVLTVLSVDGVNIVSGETAAAGQRGYILSPYQTLVVDGWRKSESEIAAFRFAPLPHSYAAQTGRPGDVGVIGMAVFTEREPPVVLDSPVPPPPPPPPPAPSPPSSRSSFSPTPAPITPAPSLAAPAERAQDPEYAGARPIEPPPAASEKLGTAHGEIEYSRVRLAGFQRSSPTPVSVRVIEYDSFDNLLAAGVIPPGPDNGRRPDPFPAERGGGGFVPDPPSGPGRD